MHAIRRGRSTPQAVQVFNIPSMHLGASGDKRLGARIRAREAEHLMTSVDEFPNDGRTDKACSTSNKNTHIFPPKQFVVQSIETKRSLGLRAESKPSR